MAEEAYRSFIYDPQTMPANDHQIERWREMGMPMEALREDRTLDIEVLRQHGWDIDGCWIMSP